MIDKKNFDKLKKNYGTVSSWAIWAPAYNQYQPKSNIGDLSVFKDPNLLDKINTGYVFVGLNASSTHGDAKENLVWQNFHSGYVRGNDYKLRYALDGTKYWGSYITDVIKHYPEVDSAKVSSYLRAHPEVVKENIADFEKELALLGDKPVLVALGGKAYEILNTYLGDKYKIVQIKHFSYTIGKEDYRKEVLKILDSIK